MSRLGSSPPAPRDPNARDPNQGGGGGEGRDPNNPDFRPPRPGDAAPGPRPPMGSGPFGSAPTHTTRQTPAGIKLKDGHSTKLAPALDPDVSFWEKAVGMPGLDGGDPIDQTTMHNVTYRTMAPRQLITLTPFTLTVAYDPNLINNIIALINREGGWTTTLSDGSQYSYFAFLQKIEFAELKEGDQPEATVTICPTNFDPVGKVEAGPLLTSVAGT